MARYERDFKGIRADLGRGRGMDPNHESGYSGMPHHVGQGQAAYGAYRWRHRQDLGGSGGYMGSYDRDVRSRYDHGYVGRGMEPGQHRRPRGYDRDQRASGGIRNWRYDRELLRDFNSASPEISRARGDYDEGGPRRAGGYDRGTRYGFDYNNRGLSSGGFSESWARGPRGAR